MTDKEKEYKELILRMLDDMEDDLQFLEIVFTIVHHHFIWRPYRKTGAETPEFCGVGGQTRKEALHHE